MFEDTSGIINRLDNLVREGVVSSVNYYTCRCRVTFSDRNGLVSDELPVLTLYASKNKTYALPAVGERVVVLSVSNDYTSGGGYVIGSLYAGDNDPDVGNENITQMSFQDGTTVTYDAAEKKITVDCEGEIAINAQGNLSIRSEGDISLMSNGSINISASDDVDITGSGSMNISAGGNLKVKGRRIDLN